MIDKDIYVSKENGNKLYVNILEKNPKGPNIIYIMTPMGTVSDFKDFYSPLTNYSCNVFALDLSGKGKSEGTMEEFSMDSIIDDIDTLITYILENYSDDIHLFGATGMGGILAQAYLTKSSYSNTIRSFSQFGAAIHQDMSIMPNSGIYRILNKIIPPMASFLPNFTIKYKIPKFDGVNAEREKEWYVQLQKDYPRELDMHIAFVRTLLGIFFNSDSSIKHKVNCPTLVFAPKHDRYYYLSYIKRYYESLDVPKTIHEMEDSHLAFVWRAQEISKEVSNWVHTYSKEAVQTP
jgi:pimeloyl-ACP methyl ester carboxylesterase